jgi:hypothetical protein
VLVAQADGPRALAAYQAGLAIREGLAKRDPANTQWQVDGTRSGGGTQTKIDCGSGALICFLVISLQPKSSLGLQGGRL